MAGVAATARERELRTPRDLHHEAYETAAGCTRCHAEHAQSFGRTFHRTMTREAKGADVRAPFAGETVSYFGVPATMDKRADGTPRMHWGGRTVEIALTVGSRRYQQYIGRVGGALQRLPWAYHLEERRWFHMNGAFLTADPTLPVTDADYTRHVTRWNDNCIFCHNVRPNPGLRAGSFDSTVEELGIACEACHGPARAHARANLDPLRRYRLHLSRSADPTIVNPARLSQERSLDVCGRCHGQRITDDVAAFLHEGDPFVPGDDLSLYSAPLWQDTTLDGEPGRFASRFWDDGTPRLTAYEYQGVLQSPCMKDGAFTCLSCHDMHAGDPHGQLRPDRTRDQLCTQCHTKVDADHAKHPARSGVTCIDCHMPSVVYGVMASHASHRIEIPDLTRAQERDRPDACTLCHVDRSRAWDTQTFSQAEQQLFGGDPLTRALTAAAYAHERLAGATRARSNALLLEVMEHDPYPGVRHLAYRSLLARESVPTDYVPEGTPDERAAHVRALRARLPHDTLPALDALRAHANDRAIDIGE
ncbi:MAG: ammonia-forming cytochrome c nitrite reductase subunit c552 [Polyangiales bacterium]